MKKIKLTALPCLCVDVFDGTDIIRPGGEALNFAVHASRFKNINVTLLGIVGNDKYAEVIMDSISERWSVTYYKGKEFKAKAVKVDTVIDTTGCGDSYHAGFVCSYILEKDIEKAMSVGSEIAAETLMHYGGFWLSDKFQLN